MCFMLSVIRGCQGCKHHCSYNDSVITGSGTPFYCEKRRFFNRASIIGKCSLEFYKKTQFRLCIHIYMTYQIMCTFYLCKVGADNRIMSWELWVDLVAN